MSSALGRRVGHLLAIYSSSSPANHLTLLATSTTTSKYEQLFLSDYVTGALKTTTQLIPAKFYSRYSASTIMTSYRKELNLKYYDIIGFDLDGTLLRYNLKEMTALIFNVLRGYLVEQRGYSPKLLEKPLDLDFLQKGLFLDGPRGNVLKLSSEAVILRATHGTRLLSEKEIEAIYGPEFKWQVTSDFYKDPLSTWNGVAATQMRSLLDYFDMPSALVFAQAVDLVDEEQPMRPPEKEYQVWRDLQAALMHNYSRDNFDNDLSLYFKEMRKDPERYVLQTSNKLIQWLQDLRLQGKKLFLLTGSNIDFANLTASQALGKDWPQLFDNVVTYAKKPGFFTAQRPFLEVDRQALKEIIETELPDNVKLSPGGIYSQGNWHQLHESLALALKKPSKEAKALYFGDNIIQDVYTPVKHRDFDAVAIAEELLLERSNYPYHSELGSQLWDSYFSVGNSITLWSDFIGKYAQICVPSMEEMAQTEPTKRLVCTNASGFYPILPKGLEALN